MLDRSRLDAIKSVKAAAHDSAAYRTLLREHRIDPAELGSHSKLSSLPVLSKANTFERFGLAELSRPISSSEFADVLTSSGRGGPSFGFRVTTRAQHAKSWFNIDLGLQDVFDVDGQRTLLVNCLPMGVVFSSRAVAVANLSVREDMACAILRTIGPSFAQNLLCTDPMFINQLLAHGQQTGLDWAALNTSVIIGEEVLAEAQRDYIAARLGIDLDSGGRRAIISSFGVGELGLNLLFESRETIRMRRAMRGNTEISDILRGHAEPGALPSVFCFNPMRCHIEVLNPDAEGFGELCFTMLGPDAVIALPRYATGDQGKIPTPDETRRAAALAGTSPPWLPVISVRGRIKDRDRGYPSVEDIKELIYTDHAVAGQLSGAFRIARQADGRVTVTIQANNPAAAQDNRLVARIASLAPASARAGLRFELLSPTDFPVRPMLDYERKFSYTAADPV
jgi:phenylacetate-CoA ligase